MKAQEIKKVISTSEIALSAKGIAKHAKIDADSSDLRAIEDECWEMVNHAELIAYDRREENIGLFFGMK